MNHAPHFYRWETAQRYYEAMALQDLWGDWVVLQRWGGKHNQRGGFRFIPIALNEVEGFMTQIDIVRRRHGYQRFMSR